MVFEKKIPIFLRLSSLLLLLELQGLPSGFEVQQGAADLKANGSEMLINCKQNSVIHWQEFSIDALETVRFQQLGADSLVLNRVLGGASSTINGQLFSNGQIYLINQNGIVFGSNSLVMSAGFTASTLNVLDEHVLQGAEIRFAGDSPNAIVNLGQIICPEGNIAILAKTVENRGLLKAMQGEVSIAAASEVLLKPDGRQRVYIRPSSSGGGEALNLGEIQALSAQIEADGNPYVYAIKTEGKISTLCSENGKIVLKSHGGKCEVKGEIAARGGQIDVFGKEIEISAASLDASGEKRGGNLRIGGDRHGKTADAVNAERVWTSSDVKISADALESGDGGSVVIWGDQLASHHGSIQARGGSQRGAGGFIEISGKYLDIFGMKNDLRAPHGQTGTLLLDPYNVVINAAGPTSGGAFSGCVPPVTFTPSATAVIQVSDLTAQLAACDVVVVTTGAGADIGTITVSDTISWATANSLTLTADANIVVNALIENTGGADVTLTAQGISGTGYTGLSIASGGISLSGGAGVLTLSGIGVGTSRIGVDIAANVDSTGSIVFSNCQGGAAGANNYGVRIGAGTTTEAPTITATTNIRGGSGTDSDYGFFIAGTLGNNTVGQPTTTTSLSIAATSLCTGTSGVGIYCEGTAQISDAGLMTLVGSGSVASVAGTNSNFGIYVHSTGLVRAGTSNTSTADIVFQGAGGNAPQGNNVGVVLLGPIILQGTGRFEVSNTTAGGGITFPGFGLFLNSSITATDGTVLFDTITGGSGGIAGCHGITFIGTSSISCDIFTATGITGGPSTGNTNHGINYNTSGNLFGASSVSISATGGGSAASSGNNGFMKQNGSGTISTGTSGTLTFSNCFGGTTAAASNGGVVLGGDAVSGNTIVFSNCRAGSNSTGTAHGVRSDLNITGTGVGDSITFLNCEGAPVGPSNLGVFLVTGTVSASTITATGIQGGTGTTDCHGFVVNSGATVGSSACTSLSITAQARGNGNTNYGIFLQGSGVGGLGALRVGSNATMTLNGSTSASAGSDVMGIRTTSALVVGGGAAGTTNITVSGTSSATGDRAMGVEVVGSTFTLTGAGNLTFTNCNGSAAGQTTCFGFDFHSTALNATSGTVVISNCTGGGTGDPGGAPDGRGAGVAQSTGSSINASTVTISNITGSAQVIANAGQAVGYYLTTPSSSIVATGALSISATGGGAGAAANSYGVWIANGTVSANTIAISGTGGAGSGGGHHGLNLSGGTVSSTGSMTFTNTPGAGATSFATNIGINLTTSGGTFTTTGSTRLSASSTIDTTNSGGMPTGASVSFNNTLDADVNTRSLTVAAGTGTVTFTGAVGGTTPLAFLTASGATILQSSTVQTVGAISYTGTTGITLAGSSLTTSGGAVGLLSGPVTLNTDVSIDTTNAGGTPVGAGISSTGNISQSTTQSLTLNAGTAGVVSIGGSLTTNAFTLAHSGSSTISGTTTVPTVTLTNTTGNITFNGAVTVSTAFNTAAQGYGVVFNGGGTVTPATTFSNTGGVQFLTTPITFTGGLVSTASTTTTSTTVNTTGTAMTLGAVALTGTTALNTSGGTLATGAVTGVQSLTINSGAGTSTIGLLNINAFTVANSGGTTVTGTTTVPTVTLTSTTGDITFNGAVTIATALNTAAQGYRVTFNGGGTVTPATTFSNTGGVRFLTDPITFTGGVNSTASTTSTSTTVNTTGTAMTFGTVSLTGISTYNTSGGTLTTGAVTGMQNLIINSGTGASTLASLNVSTFTVTNSGGTTISGATVSPLVVLGNTTGNITFNGAVTISGQLLTAANGYGVIFNGGGTVQHFMSLTTFLNTGGVQFNTSPITFTDGVISTASTTTTSTTVNTTGDPMTFGAVVLTGASAYNTSGGTLTTGAVSGAESLSINSGAGASTIGSLNINAFTVANSGGTTVTGTTTVPTVTLTNTTGNITFNGAVTVSTAFNTAAQGYGIVFNGGGTVTPSTTFSNTGGVQFLTVPITFTGGLISTAGTTTTSTTVQTAANAISIGELVLAGASTISTTQGGVFPAGANVTVSGNTNGASALTLIGGTGGDVSFSTVGNTTPLTTLTASGLSVTQSSTVQTAGAVSYTGLIGLGGNITTSGGTVGLTGAVTLNDNVAIDTTDGAPAGASITASANVTQAAVQSLTVNGGTSGTVSIGGNLEVDAFTLTNSSGAAIGGTTTSPIVTLTATTGNITFADAVTVSTAFNTTATGYAVFFNNGGTVTPATTLLNSGGVTFAGSPILFSGGLTSTASATTSSVDVRTAGNPIAIGALTLAGASVFDATNAGGVPAGANVSILGAANGANSLTLNAGTTGVAAFASIGNATPLASFAASGLNVTQNANVQTVGNVSYIGAIGIGGNITTVTGAMMMTGAVELNADSIFLATAGGAISFSSTVNGNQTFIVDAGTGSVTFGGAVGNTTPLNVLDVSGSAINVATNVSAQGGTLIFNDPVVLLGDVIFTDTGNTGISFLSTITGNHNLSIQAMNGDATVAGNINTNGAIGGAVTIDAPNGTILVAGINTSGTAGNAGHIALQPDASFSTGTLGAGTAVPNGRLGIYGDLIATSIGGTAGTISLSAAGRTEVMSVATIFGNPAGSDLTIQGDSLVIGPFESTTVFGTITVTTGTSAQVGDMISLNGITITSPIIGLLLHGDGQILDSFGQLYTTENLHFISTGTNTLIGTQVPIGVGPAPDVLTLVQFTPSQFADLLTFSGYVLNFDANVPPPPPPPPIPITPSSATPSSAFFSSIYKFVTANSQISYYLPQYPNWEEKYPVWKDRRYKYFRRYEEVH